MANRIHSAVRTGLVAVLGAAAWPAVSTAHSIAHQQSANWAGYANTAHAPLDAVSGEWVQPAATCDQPYATYSAFWVGLGGFKHTSHAVEQAGTEADCSLRGRPRTYAWYELVPSPPVKLKLAVQAGNVIKARVVVRGRRVTLTVDDLSTGHGATKSVMLVSPDENSAEWIAEAPSACVSASQCQPLPLTDFGTVSFSQAKASTSRGQTGTITDPAFWTTEMTLSPGGPVIGPAFAAAAASGAATPSGLAPSGTGFSVTYEKTSGPFPPPPVAALDQVRHDVTAP